MTKFTEVRKKIIYDAISTGMSQKDACALSGVDESTLCRWKNENKDFANQLDKKEVEYKQSLIQRVKKAGEDQWQANAWILERKWKSEFSAKTEIENSGEIIVRKVTNAGDNPA